MSAPMTIIQVAGSAEWAGGERQLLDLASGLDPARFRFQVICPEPGPLETRLKASGVPCTVVPLAPLVNPAAILRLAGVLAASSPALVQSHGARSNFYARLACARAGLRNVSTVHNALAAYPVPAWKRALYQSLDNWSVRWAAAVVCVSESLRRDLEAQGCPAGKLRVIRNGVDLKAFDPARADRRKPREEWGVGPEDVLLGVVGRLTEQKGHRYFLEALRALAPGRPRLKGVIVGDGPLRAELEAAARGLPVVFAGVRHDMPDVLAALDVVALPSVSEGLPYALLEALAMGRPTAASAVDGVVEVVEADGRGARLVPPRDVPALASVLAELVDSPERSRALAAEGRERVIRDFSLDSMAKRWTELYAELGEKR